jgi:two-component system NtrC family sensor kinase
MLIRSLGGKLIIAVGMILILSIGIFAFISIRDQRNQLIREVILGAGRFSDTVVRSTRYDMLKVQREDVHKIIEAIGEQNGIEQVRIFNKEGVIMFSTDKVDTGTRVDMEAEACYACHAAQRPIERLATPDRTRIYRPREDYRVLGMITGIYNEPDCYTADCHAHPREKTVLGVLDIVMSLEDVDREIAENRRKVLFFALMMIVIISILIGGYIYKSVTVPIHKLVTGTKKIASGDLSYRIDAISKGEIGELAQSYNTMADNLEEAKSELTKWAKTLERRVEERTIQLKKTQNQLMQSEKLASLGKLAAGVAHELNNPLTGVLTYASLLHESAPEESEQKEDLEIIINETKRCREIIRGLLDFARQSKPAKKEVNINSVLQDTLAVIKYQSVFRDIEIVQKLDESIPPVPLDADQFEQVFMNIIMNAAEAMPDGGTLTLETSLTDGGNSIQLSFSDTGSGIKKEHMDKLFDPFFTTKEVGKGTGLGLAVTYGIVKRHNGTIEVKSTIGEGTTFIVTLPLKKTETKTS